MLTTITSVESTTTPVPYCKIRGFVTNVNPGPNDSNFLLGLPDDFAGRYFLINLGGNSGYAVDPSIPAMDTLGNGFPARRLAEGFAFAATDTGNQNPSLDYSFLTDKGKALDQAWRGPYSVAVSENGNAPDSLIGTSPATPTRAERTFLVCPYPDQAQYKRGDVNAATSWRCKRQHGRR